MNSASLASLERAIIEALAYSDIFDYPLTLDELHRYLTIPAGKDELIKHKTSISSVKFSDGYYFLANRESNISTRRERECNSHPAFYRSLRYGRILGALPFVRMVALTGSLAMLNLSRDADMDFFLVTKTGRLWLARAFAVTFSRILRLFGDRICVNVLISDVNLEWNTQDLYSAREICQMIPVTGMDVYWKLREDNAWTDAFLPNARTAPVHAPKADVANSSMQALLEFLLRGSLGDMIEKWAMNLQLKKIYSTYGAGGEANFTPNLCQGNFHGHRAGTERSFQQKLSALNRGE